MVLRYARSLVRVLSRSVVLVALVALSWGLLLMSACTPQLASDEQGELDLNYQLLAPGDDGAQAQVVRRMHDAWEQGDWAAYAAAKADWLEQGPDGVGTARPTLYRALSELESDPFLTSVEDLPATLFLLAPFRNSLSPLTGILPFLSVHEGGVDAYDTFVDGIAWVVPLMVSCLVAAGLQGRGRLARAAPFRTGLRGVAASASCALVSLGCLVLAWLPALVFLGVRNGIGDLAFPVVAGSGGDFVVRPAAEALAWGALLCALTALLLSLVAHLSVSLFGSVVPAAAAFAATLAALVATHGAGWPAWLPMTYLDLPGVVGAFTYLPTVPLRAGATPSRGVVALVGWCALAAGGLALGEGALARGGARPASGGGPRATHLMDPRDGAAVTQTRGARRREALALMGSLARALLARPLPYALCALVAALLVWPLVLDAGMDAGAYERSGYQNELTRLSLLESGLEPGSAERAEARGMRDTLSAFVFSQGRSEGWRALGAYEDLRVGLYDRGSELVDPVGFDCAQVRARSRLLAGLAEGDFDVYPSARQMPLLVYLSWVLGTVPAAAWLVPAATICLAACDLVFGPALIAQAPAARSARLGASVGVSLLLSLAVVLVPLVLVSLGVALANGIGDASYPVVWVRAGEVCASTLGPTLSWTALLAGVSCLVVVTLGCAAALMGRSPRAAAVSLAVLAALGLACSAQATSSAALAPLSAALAALPLTCLDFARAAGFADCGVPVLCALPAGPAAGAAGLLLLSSACVACALARAPRKGRGGRHAAR